MSMLISTQSSIQSSRVNALLASQLADLLALAAKSLGQDISTARGCIAQAAELLSFPSTRRPRQRRQSSTAGLPHGRSSASRSMLISTSTGPSPLRIWPFWCA